MFNLGNQQCPNCQYQCMDPVELHKHMNKVNNIPLVIYYITSGYAPRGLLGLLKDWSCSQLSPFNFRFKKKE